jgi:hypothetical protein
MWNSVTWRDAHAVFLLRDNLKHLRHELPA